MAIKKAKKSTKKGDIQPESIAPVPEAAPETETPAPTPTAGIADPIGDTTDGEAKAYLGDETQSESATEETPEAEPAA
jgi:hypothetical protein